MIDWNAYHCMRTDFDIMEFESIAVDKQLRMLTPVNVTIQIPSGDGWMNMLNAWREWEWSGLEPLNMRLMQFWCLLLLNNTYNLSYTGMNPAQSHYKL